MYIIIYIVYYCLVAEISRDIVFGCMIEIICVSQKVPFKIVI